MHQNTDQLLQVIHGLHAGATSDDAWTAGLDRLSDAMGGVAIVSGASTNAAGCFHLHGHRIAPESAAMIKGRLATPQANPLIRLLPSAPVGVPLPTDAVCSRREFLDSEVYQEALRPFGVRYVIAALLDKAPERVSLFAMGRFKGSPDFGAADIRLLSLLIPHIAAASKTREAFAAARSQSAEAVTALDAVSGCVLVVDGSGALRFATAAAERLLEEADGLMVNRTGLRTARTEDSVRLKALVAAASATARGQGKAIGGTMAIRRLSGRAPYVVHVTPLLDSLGAGLIPDGAVAIAIRDPEAETGPTATALRELYGLTAAEAALTQRLCTGCSLGQAAADLRITSNTAKSQLKVIFDKLNVARQSALVRRVTNDFASRSFGRVGHCV